MWYSSELDDEGRGKYKNLNVDTQKICINMFEYSNVYCNVSIHISVEKNNMYKNLCNIMSISHDKRFKTNKKETWSIMKQFWTLISST